MWQPVRSSKITINVYLIGVQFIFAVVVAVRIDYGDDDNFL